MSFSKCGNGTGTDPPGSYTKEDLALEWSDMWATGEDLFDGHDSDEVVDALQVYCAGMADVEGDRAALSEKIDDFASVMANNVPLFVEKAAAFKTFVDTWLDSNSVRLKGSTSAHIKEIAAQKFEDGPAGSRLYPIDPAEGYFFHPYDRNQHNELYIKGNLNTVLLSTVLSAYLTDGTFDEEDGQAVLSEGPSIEALGSIAQKAVETFTKLYYGWDPAQRKLYSAGMWDMPELTDGNFMPQEIYPFKQYKPGFSDIRASNGLIVDNHDWNEDIEGLQGLRPEIGRLSHVGLYGTSPSDSFWSGGYARNHEDAGFTVDANSAANTQSGLKQAARSRALFGGIDDTRLGMSDASKGALPGRADGWEFTSSKCAVFGMIMNSHSSHRGATNPFDGQHAHGTGCYDGEGPITHGQGAAARFRKNTDLYTNAEDYNRAYAAWITAETGRSATASDALSYSLAISELMEGVEQQAKAMFIIIKNIIRAYVDYLNEVESVAQAFRDLGNELREATNVDAQYGREGEDTDDPVADVVNAIIEANSLRASRGVNTNRIQAQYYRQNPEKLFYREQCFLLTYVNNISNYKATKLDPKPPALDYEAGSAQLEAQERGEVALGRKQLPYLDLDYYGNSTILLNGDPYGFLNKLAISKNIKALMNIPPHALSQLQPYIRLFKVERALLDTDLYTRDSQYEDMDVEILFDPAFTTFEQNLYNEGKVRSPGTGLKSFEFTYDGSNPFGARKSIKATLKIFASSFDQLFEQRRSPTVRPGTDENYKYRYVDLALKTFNADAESESFRRIQEENEELASLNFRLKATVGYRFPSNGITGLPYGTGENRVTRASLQTALNDSHVTLNLTPTIHSFEIDELGRTVLVINYLAYVEELFNEARFNVFSGDHITLKRIIRNLQMDKYQQECEPQAVSEIKKQHAIIARQETSRAISSLITQMMEDDRIFYMPISMDQIKEFISYGPWSGVLNKADFGTAGSAAPQVLRREDYESYLGSAIDVTLDVFEQEAREDELEFDRDDEAITAALATSNSHHQVLAYFYVSELIDAILKNIEEELLAIDWQLAVPDHNLEVVYDPSTVDAEQLLGKREQYENYIRAFTRMRFVLGPIEFANPDASGESIFVNLGDIPISLKYFIEWLTSTMLDKDDSFFSLTSFMNQFFNKFISQFLNNDRCFDYSVRQRVRMYQATITGAGTTDAAEFDLDPISDLLNDEGVSRANIDELEESFPLIRTFGSARDSAVNTISQEVEFNYMIYYVGRTNPTSALRGDRHDDEEAAIFHYQIGRDAGLVKDIKLTKTQTPGLQEVRFEQEGYDGLQQLRVVYDAEISSYANINTFPGCYIFIEPKGYAPRTNLELTKYGIGGYYMIVKSSHFFGPGKADSTIHAKWVNQIDDPENQITYVASTAGTEGTDTKQSACGIYVQRAEAAAEIE